MQLLISSPVLTCLRVASNEDQYRAGCLTHANCHVASTTGAATMDTNRLAKELREILADTKSGVTVTVIGDDLGHMQGTLLGEKVFMG